ncbi:DUF433 domain-containing protein [Candidatus Woesearchaeota archaeon]|nr:DUF433 domain-containing protein [Candidatus Woesearchaeota archaeon]
MAIIINADLLKGKPIIAGTRISVELVLDLLSSGMSIDEIIKEYPHLTKKKILEAIKYAKKSLEHEEVVSFSSPVQVVKNAVSN